MAKRLSRKAQGLRAEVESKQAIDAVMDAALESAVTRRTEMLDQASMEWREGLQAHDAKENGRLDFMREAPPTIKEEISGVLSRDTCDCKHPACRYRRALSAGILEALKTANVPFPEAMVMATIAKQAIQYAIDVIAELPNGYIPVAKT